MKASDYKKHTQKQVKENLINLTLPSGAVFKVRRPPLEQFIASGQIPSSLLGKILLSVKANGINSETGEDLLKQLTPEEIIENMAFGCKLIVFCCVEPKIVLSEKAGEHELTPEDILPEDFSHLLQWSMSGGSESVTLETFRKGRQ